MANSRSNRWSGNTIPEQGHNTQTQKHTYKTNMTPNPNTQKRKYSVQQILEHAPDPHPAPLDGSCASEMVSSAHKYTLGSWIYTSYIYFIPIHIPQPTNIHTHIGFLNPQRSYFIWCSQRREHTKHRPFFILSDNVSQTDMKVGKLESWSIEIIIAYSPCMIAHAHFWYSLILQKIMISPFILLKLAPRPSASPSSCNCP